MTPYKKLLDYPQGFLRITGDWTFGLKKLWLEPLTKLLSQMEEGYDDRWLYERLSHSLIKTEKSLEKIRSSSMKQNPRRAYFEVEEAIIQAKRITELVNHLWGFQANCHSFQTEFDMTLTGDIDRLEREMLVLEEDRSDYASVQSRLERINGFFFELEGLLLERARDLTRSAQK